MRYGFVYPGDDARAAVRLAEEAEAAGWDGFFVWDAVWGADPWATLGAIAVSTVSIRIGTMITPVSRRRPWKLASETATVDRLSDGRLILSVGLGAPDTGFEKFGEETDRKARAELLDEGLKILTGLWRGQPFSFTGKHYQVTPGTLQLSCPLPLQEPRIPIWVVGAWPRRKSIARVLRYDGLLPDILEKKGRTFKRRAVTPDDIRAMRDYVAAHRSLSTPFDIVQEGTTPGDDLQQAREIVRPWADAGATWWIEAMWGQTDTTEVRHRLRQGPPRLT